MNAYYISGHGDQDLLRTFTVPTGCTIVVKAHPSEGTLYTEMPTFCNTDIEVLTHPIERRAELYEAFKSVAIYPAGSKCPHFTYSLNCIVDFTYCGGTVRV